MANGRPILSLQSHSVEALDATQPASVLLTMGNLGHAPAANVYFGMECLLVDSHECFEQYAFHVLCEMPMRLGGTQLQPGECLDLHFPLKHLHRTHLAAINRGERLLLILARVEYASLGGEFHWTHVCLQFDGRAVTLHHEVRDLDITSANGVLLSHRAFTGQAEF